MSYSRGRAAPRNIVSLGEPRRHHRTRPRGSWRASLAARRMGVVVAPDLLRTDRPGGAIVLVTPLIQMKLRTAELETAFGASYGKVRNWNAQQHAHTKFHQGWDLEAPVGT